MGQPARNTLATFFARLRYCMNPTDKYKSHGETHFLLEIRLTVGHILNDLWAVIDQFASENVFIPADDRFCIFN